MKKSTVQLFIGCICLLIAFSCKKNSSEDLSDLNAKASANQLSLASVSFDKAEFSISQLYINEGYPAVICLRKANGAKWDTLSVNAQSVKASNLASNTNYEAKLLFFSGKNSKEVNTITFTTKSFIINYKRMYGIGQAAPEDFKSESSMYVLSIENGKQTIYGKGFSGKEVSVTFFQQGTTNSGVSAAANVLNDSMMQITIPANMPRLYPNKPYENYYATFNGEVFPSLNAVINNHPAALAQGDTAYFEVINPKIYIDSAYTFYGPGRQYEQTNIRGFFAGNQFSVPYFLGLPTIPVNRTLTIKQAGTVIQKINVVDRTIANQTSHDLGTAQAANSVMSSLMIDHIYHDVNYVYLSSNLPNGSYTAQLEISMADGSKFTSNEYRFSVNL